MATERIASLADYGLDPIDETDVPDESTKKKHEVDSKKAREQKLFDLRMKANAGRKHNYQEVSEEDRRSKEPAGAEAKRERDAYQKQKEDDEQRMREEGLDPDKERLLNQSSAEAEWRAKKAKRSDASFGWEQFNTDAEYNSYERRVKSSAQVDAALYDKQREELGADSFYAAPHTNLAYGTTPDVPQSRVDAMADELAKQVAKRGTFSRRRERIEGEYQYHISERNRVYNKKLERAFGKYTTEIRQNLERGTAL
eukprot:TRINITY_DN15706_c0_g1_i1.p1 TRINITY_DN15706_c0_g1~~TRINITY_DN15706_c0_g1_i1.p1  ORF type:complete len:255 (-),score=69.12 TRINITY_DN15706_c0_g1_i1:329-1093(-)